MGALAGATPGGVQVMFTLNTNSTVAVVMDSKPSSPEYWSPCPAASCPLWPAQLPVPVGWQVDETGTTPTKHAMGALIVPPTAVPVTLPIANAMFSFQPRELDRKASHKTVAPLIVPVTWPV